MSKIPFSIEYRPLIESGEYKVEIGREDPWPARIVCWNLDGDNIIAVVMNPEGREEGLIYTKQGKHNAICPRIDSDLFIIIPEPELAESEDERIRRTLVEYFGPSAQLDFIRGVPIQKIRNWLEKQKEHQNNSDAPKEKSVGGNFSSSHKDKNLDEIAQDYVDGVKEYNSEPTWDLMQTAVCYGYHYREQKEQKPVQFKNNELMDIIKGEFEGFRTLLKKAGIDYEPQRSYWEGLARLFDSSAREYVKKSRIPLGARSRYEH